MIARRINCEFTCLSIKLYDNNKPMKKSGWKSFNKSFIFLFRLIGLTDVLLFSTLVQKITYAIDDNKARIE